MKLLPLSDIPGNTHVTDPDSPSRVTGAAAYRNTWIHIVTAGDPHRDDLLDSFKPEHLPAGDAGVIGLESQEHSLAWIGSARIAEQAAAGNKPGWNALVAAGSFYGDWPSAGARVTGTPVPADRRPERPVPRAARPVPGGHREPEERRDGRGRRQDRRQARRRDDLRLEVRRPRDPREPLQRGTQLRRGPPSPGPDRHRGRDPLMDLHDRCEEMFRQHRDILHWNPNGYALLNLLPPSGPVTFQLRRETKDARYSLSMLPGDGGACIIRCDGEITGHGWITAEQASTILDGCTAVSARPHWTTWEAAGTTGLAKLMTAAGYADGYAIVSFTIHPGPGTAEPVPPVMRDRLRLVRDAIRREALQSRYPIASDPADYITAPLAAVPAETLERESRLICPAVTISGYSEDVYGVPCRAALLPVMGADTASVTTLVFEPPEDTSHDRDQ